MHQEPPDEVCGVLELAVGFDFGDVRPDDFVDFDELPDFVDEVPDFALVPPVEPLVPLLPALPLVPLPWPADVLAWLEEPGRALLALELAVVAADEVIPGRA
jgi:hypothetical protein